MTGVQTCALPISGYQPSGLLNQTVTVSAHVKRGELDQCALNIQGEGAVSYFDLTNGVVAQEGAGYSSSIETLANGWYRIQSTVSNKTTNFGNVSIMTAKTSQVTYSGTGQGIYVYGLQLEVGAFATSYIHNTTTANARGTDTLTLTSSEFQRRYDATGMSFMMDSKLTYRPTTKTNNQKSALLSFSDGTINNRISVLSDTRSASAERYAKIGRAHV